MASIPLRLEGARRILLIKPSALGDVVQAIPVAATLKRRYPDIALDWLVEEEAADILGGHSALCSVLVSGRHRWLRQLRNPGKSLATLREIRDFSARLRQRCYDVVVDLQGLLKSALYVLAARAPIRVGFAEGREGAPWVLTHRVVAPPQPVHAVDRYLALAAAMDATEAVREFQIIPSRDDEALGRSLLGASKQPRVALHPVARWRTKLWEPARWQDLAATLHREGIQVILTGSREDQPLGAAITRGLDPPPLSLMGRLSLKQLAVILREVDLAVTVDSGPMHIAAAMGTPVVALFGPTDPRRTGPLGPGRVLRRHLDCSPCLQRRCRVQDMYRCMRELGVPEVVEAVRHVLGSRNRRENIQPQISQPASSSGETIPQIFCGGIFPGESVKSA